MNCFEARQEFAAVWRGSAPEARRAELLAHLAGCAKCDRAFRIFALSAPVLHGGLAAAPAASSGSAPQQYPFDARTRRLAASPRRERGRPRRSEASQWMAMAAAVAIFVLSGTAAYLAARVPGESLTEAISSAETEFNGAEAVSDLFGPEQPIGANDFVN